MKVLAQASAGGGGRGGGVSGYFAVCLRVQGGGRGDTAEDSPCRTADDSASSPGSAQTCRTLHTHTHTQVINDSLTDTHMDYPCYLSPKCTDTVYDSQKTQINDSFPKPCWATWALTETGTSVYNILRNTSINQFNQAVSI